VLERTLFPNGIAVLTSSRLRSEGFLAAFTERSGGVSDGAFASLNLGLRAGDDIGRAIRNRRLLATTLGLDGFAAGQQVHGTRVVRVGRGRAGSGFEDPALTLRGTDAMCTSTRGIGLAVLTADCVPIALADPSTGLIAAVHAGWRGIARGMVRAAVGRFRSPGDVLAVIGPAIGPDHYEVGPDVAAAVGDAVPGGAPITRRGGRLLLDLAGSVEAILRHLGVPRVEQAGACTACKPDRFYSYRRDGLTGRQGLVVARL
jgi:YfiH family protein